MRSYRPPDLVDDLSKQAPVTLVGYGVQERIVGGGPPVWAGLRIRLMAPARLVSGSFTHSEEFVRVTASPGQGGGTCFGDSGGPVLSGNGDTVLAVNSYVTNSNCAGVTYSHASTSLRCWPGSSRSSRAGPTTTGWGRLSGPIRYSRGSNRADTASLGSTVGLRGRRAVTQLRASSD